MSTTIPAGEKRREEEEEESAKNRHMNQHYRLERREAAAGGGETEEEGGGGFFPYSQACTSNIGCCFCRSSSYGGGSRRRRSVCVLVSLLNKLSFRREVVNCVRGRAHSTIRSKAVSKPFLKQEVFLRSWLATRQFRCSHFVAIAHTKSVRQTE